MMLIGNNLGERHRDLNSKVAEAVAKQTNFEELKSQPEHHDIDKLFKIDIASKYKKIDYILEVLRCGDIFYITRALKCLWLYNDEYSQFINTDYLQANIFSYMSEKMKRKMLTSISTHMTNSNRAIDFYKYCKNGKLNDYAVKFLVYTPDNFKLEAMKDYENFSDFNESKFLKTFIGSSFVLAQSYIDLYEYYSDIMHELRFLYSVSDEKYLNILEEYIQTNATDPCRSQRLGIRTSRDILKRHKQRIFKKPLLYVNILNKTMLVKHLTIDDVKSLSLDLLPGSSEDFWSIDFCDTYKFILEKFPASELFVYLKQIYISKYNDDTFEMRIEFYNLKYYEIMNIDEREAWALRHIECDKELPDIKNYIWYKFVSLQNAFCGIKRYIFLTPDKEERSQIVNILPETARNMDDINKILYYYYERHVNESEEHKESFINKIIELHDIYSFNNECWTSLDNLFYSLELYTTASYVRAEYKFLSTVYHIIHTMELPEALKEYIDNAARFYDITPSIEALSEERKAVVAKYLLNYYAEKIKPLMDHPDYNNDKDGSFYWGNSIIKDKVHDLVCNVWCAISRFNRNSDDCPEIAVKFMELHMDVYKYHYKYRTPFVNITENDFVRWLKQDIQMAVDGINKIRCNTYRWNFRLCRLFRKLKVYFPQDVGKKYEEYFIDYLSDVPGGMQDYRNIKMAVVGVLYLADQDFIFGFLEKNVPADPKIDHMNLCPIFQLQKAICRLAYHARPPLPLCSFKKYIVGDYVRYCLPVIYNYFANLQSNEKFIDTLLDAPLSIQKHGLRLAFKGYNTDKLIPIITSAWNKTKNVSLRIILFESLFNRILKENEEVQRDLYKVLKLFTSELNHDDHDNVYSLLISDDLPDVFKGDYIETAWLTVSKLSDKQIDIKRRTSVVCHMESYIHLVQRDFPRLQIIDDHVNDRLYKKNINRDNDEDYVKELISAKWNLTAKYIISFTNKAELGKSLELMQTIMAQCIESWDLVTRETYTVRKFMQKFIKIIMTKDPKTAKSCKYTVLVYQCILDNLRIFLKKEEIYLINWELQLSITCRSIIYNKRKKSIIGADNPKHHISRKEIADVYGKEVAIIVKSFVKNNEFYSCFYLSVAKIINNIGCTICEFLDIDSPGFIYYVCDSLTDIKMTETHILALCMLPRDPHSDWESKHMETIVKIKQFDNSEVRSLLYEKYVSFDCKVRRYATPEYNNNLCSIL